MTDIFADGLESGDTSAWTGTLFGLGGLAPSVVVSPVHHGSYAAKTGLNGTGAWSVIYKQFGSSYSLLYARAYIRLSTTPASGVRLQIGPCIEDLTANNHLSSAFIYNDGGTLKWDLQYKTDTTAENHAYATSPAITQDTWYCIEVLFKAATGTGEVAMWVNGTQRIDVTGLANDDVNTQRIEVGLYSSSTITVDEYADCVKVADTGPIGVESAGGISIPVVMYNRRMQKMSLADVNGNWRTSHPCPSFNLNPISVHVNAWK